MRLRILPFKRKAAEKPIAVSTAQANRAGSIGKIISTVHPLEHLTAAAHLGRKPDLILDISNEEFRSLISSVKKQPDFNEKGELQEDGEYSFAALARFEDGSRKLYLVKKEN